MTREDWPQVLKTFYDSDLPTNLVDVAAIRAVINYDKQSEMKLAPHLPKDALDLGKKSIF